jgi:hypothetical protein
MSFDLSHRIDRNMPGVVAQNVTLAALANGVSPDSNSAVSNEAPLVPLRLSIQRYS